MTNVSVLPAAAPLVHRVAEGDARVGIGEPERAAGTEVPERARVGTERALDPWRTRSKAGSQAP